MSLWWCLHGLGGLLALFIVPSWSGALVCLALTGLTICLGHSIGMHRLLIHRSFETSKPVEYLMVWLGVLVGMAGPFGMIKAHDMRDWHQRQSSCPDHPAHRAGFWRDGWWQLHCTYELNAPPELEIEPRVADDPFYLWMERFWMAQQLPLALLLWYFGGVSWVLWGISLRIWLSLTGHWAVGHFAHKRGMQTWAVDGVAVQGYNLPRLGWLTFGENWHGNHHAFPHSARLGLAKGEADPGFLVLQTLARLGLVWNIRGPDDAPPRDGLYSVSR